MDGEYQERQDAYTLNPFPYVLYFLATFGWYVIGAVAAVLYTGHRLRPLLRRWQDAKEDADLKKNPDKALARMEAIQRARDKQQELLEQASQRAIEQQKEREERKRQEMAERLQKYGAAAGGQKLGTADDDYLPLSGGASTSSYRPPKRSKCGGGGCGR